MSKLIVTSEKLDQLISKLYEVLQKKTSSANFQYDESLENELSLIGEPEEITNFMDTRLELEVTTPETDQAMLQDFLNFDSLTRSIIVKYLEALVIFGKLQDNPYQEKQQYLWEKLKNA